MLDFLFEAVFGVALEACCAFLDHLLRKKPATTMEEIPDAGIAVGQEQAIEVEHLQP